MTNEWRLRKSEWGILKYGHLYVTNYTIKDGKVFDIRLGEDEQRAFRFDNSQTFDGARNRIDGGEAEPDEVYSPHHLMKGSDRMILAYYSLTGNTADFIDWYFPEFESRNIEVWDADEPYVLFTPTYDDGEVPEEVSEWLEQNTEVIDREFGGSADEKQNNYYMEAVVGGGNRNFGLDYAKAGDIIEAKYGVPLLMKYELKGNPQVAELIKERMAELLP